MRSPDFWRIILINLLVSAFVYMLMPLWPYLLETKEGVSMQSSGWMMMLFGIGLFLPGAFASYLLDKYRRKDVCLWSILILVVVSFIATLDIPMSVVGLSRLVQGGAFALFHISLGNTILIDSTISERRDLASFIYFWTCRFALALGPAFGILALRPDLWDYLQYFPIVCAALAVLLVSRIHLPFRSPLERKMLSLDRFWLPSGWPLVLLVFPVTFALGVEMASNLHPLYFVALFVGFVLSLILHFAVFYRSDVRAEIFTGYLAILFSFILLLYQDTEVMVRVSAGLMGYGVGCATGRLQSFLTVVSDHTDRGSAQGSYKLTFELGLCCGFFMTCAWGSAGLRSLAWMCVAGTILALLGYLFLVHRWFLHHVRR